ncbi:MAG: GAF domain-containing protein, partial [Candidatus Latescibacteria bacterium]|nr:GAF domain-containing protein [Candidatus Latescibacterota bacterium]
MATETKSLEQKIRELERELGKAREVAAYFQRVAGESGRRCVREVDTLSRLYVRQREMDRQLRYKLDLDKLINDISSTFLSLSTDDVDKGILGAIEKIGRFYDVDRSYVILFDDDLSRGVTTHEWCAEGIEAQKDKLQDIDLKAFPEILTIFTEGSHVQISNVSKLSGSEFRSHLESQDIKSLITVPLYHSDRLIGTMGFDSVRRERTWNDVDIVLVRTIGDILVSAMERSRMDRERRALEEQLLLRRHIDSLGTMAGGIAHDINNLLSVIIGNVELLRRQANLLTDNQRLWIDNAHKSCERAASLIKDVQEFANGAVPEKFRVDLYEIIEDVFGILARKSLNVDFSVGFPHGRFHVLSNTDQMHQVFLNLGTNSLYALEERGEHPGPAVTVSAGEYSAAANNSMGISPGEYIHVMFSDNGAGMTGDVRRRAFEPLFTTRRDTKKGQGLGLAMVYNIVTKNHGGHVEIESEPGRGTVFHLY